MKIQKKLPSKLIILKDQEEKAYLQITYIMHCKNKKNIVFNFTK